MEIRLGESIRRLRKEAGFTQEQLADAMGWGLKHPDVVNIIDRFDVRIYTILAGISALRGEEAGAKKWLREAKKSALRFDADPQYRTAYGMKFYHSSEKSMSYDDMGDTGMAMIENFVAEESGRENLRLLWEKVKAEATEE